ncbi:MAG: hemerythrin domain-containing protein [Actinobacteria bacterium]|nr:hemerythrin domain-containing protein [Actinomycetota bacterium]
MNAITLLKQDHRTVEELFKRFESLGPRAYKGKRNVVDRIVAELSVHAVIEEMVLYPAIRAEFGQHDVSDLVLESLEEHHVVKWTLSELDGMDPEAERFDAKVKVLMESVRHHVKEEERDLFPAVSKVFGRTRLEELGETLARAKDGAPTRPHPRSPDEPPGNIVAGAGAAVMDKARDTGRKVVRQTLGKAGVGR